MVMNKREREELDEAIVRAEILLALRWTVPECPDIPIPAEGVTTGWLYNHVSKKAYEAWSHSNIHGDMPYMPKYGRKNGIELYSTKTRALAAMRHVIEKQMAMELLDVDKMIIASSDTKSNL